MRSLVWAGFMTVAHAVNLRSDEGASLSHGFRMSASTNPTAIEHLEAVMKAEPVPGTQLKLTSTEVLNKPQTPSASQTSSEIPAKEPAAVAVKPTSKAPAGIAVAPPTSNAANEKSIAEKAVADKAVADNAAADKAAADKVAADKAAADKAAADKAAADKAAADKAAADKAAADKVAADKATADKAAADKKQVAPSVDTKKPPTPEASAALAVSSAEANKVATDKAIADKVAIETKLAEQAAAKSGSPAASPAAPVEPKPAVVPAQPVAAAAPAQPLPAAAPAQAEAAVVPAQPVPAVAPAQPVPAVAPATGKGHFSIISMPGDVKRRAYMQGQCNAIKLKCQFIDAVRGSAIPDTEWKELVVRQKVQMSRAEVGCYQSHRKCWENIVNTDIPYSLILEDDVTISQDLVGIDEMVERLHELDPDWDIVYMGMNHDTKMDVGLRYAVQHQGTKLPSVFSQNLFNPEYWKDSPTTCDTFMVPEPRWGCFGLAVSKNGAKKLLQMAKEEGMIYPVDWQLWSHQFRKKPTGNPFIQDDPYHLHIYAHKTAVLPKTKENCPMIVHDYKFASDLGHADSQKNAVR